MKATSQLGVALCGAIESKYTIEGNSTIAFTSINEVRSQNLIDIMTKVCCIQSAHPAGVLNVSMGRQLVNSRTSRTIEMNGIGILLLESQLMITAPMTELVFSRLKTGPAMLAPPATLSSLLNRLMT